MTGQDGGDNAVLLLGLRSDVIMELIGPMAAAGVNLHIGGLADLSSRPWRLVVCGLSLPGVGGLELIASMRVRSSLPPRVLLIGPSDQLPEPDDLNLAPAGIECLPWPSEPEVVVARVHYMLRAPTLHAAPLLPRPPKIALADEKAFLALATAERALVRAGRVPGDSFVASVRLDELDRFRAQWPRGSHAGVWQQVAQLAGLDALADERLGLGAEGELLMLLPGVSRREADARLCDLSARIANQQFQILGQGVRFTPVLGYAGLGKTDGARQGLSRAREAERRAHLRLDLMPMDWQTPKKPTSRRQWAPAWWIALLTRHPVVTQYLITMALGLGLPFLVYWGLGRSGHDISHGMYLFVVAALVLTSLAIWAEGFLALRREDPPDQPASNYPPASAIIAAYLPNEAPIIEDTVRAFLRVQYPAALQIILAYNTPRDMPEIEQRLHDIAREDPRFVPMRVRTSTSKAQNVNAALPYATGEFTAVFDADHQPDPDSFRRAWRWLSHGADIVQGHCFIRNGENSWVARMVAIEFEQIYVVNHPGRARLHGFGIFGGSNGYWRTSLLRKFRMHGFMLTEDIDSSMRAVVSGHRIVSDPYLVSRELAPETLRALTGQRLRWAQGWLQVSLKWIRPTLRSPHLSLRQKLGMMNLLAWREVFPWISLQILPLIAWWAVQAGSLSKIDWFVPLFVVTTLFTLSTGPGQIVFIYRLADPQIKRHWTWFWFYIGTSTLFYSGLKNAWNRIAHYKEWRGETTWVVTARVEKP